MKRIILAAALVAVPSLASAGDRAEHGYAHYRDRSTYSQRNEWGGRFERHNRAKSGWSAHQERHQRSESNNSRHSRAASQEDR
jgi:hypothetical protein